MRLSRGLTNANRFIEQLRRLRIRLPTGCLGPVLCYDSLYGQFPNCRSLVFCHGLADFCSTTWWHLRVPNGGNTGRGLLSKIYNVLGLLLSGTGIVSLLWCDSPPSSTSICWTLFHWSGCRNVQRSWVSICNEPWVPSHVNMPY